MLTGLTIKNFKAAVDASVSLSQLTLLVGPNGAGKTTVLQAIDLLGWLSSAPIDSFLSAHRGEYSDLPHLRSSSSRFSVAAELALEIRRGPSTPAASEKIVWEIELGARRFPGVAGERVLRGGRPVLERRGRKMSRLDEASGEEERVEQTLTSSWLSTVDTKRDARRFPTLVAVRSWAERIRGYFFLDPVGLRSPNRGNGQEIGLHGEFLAPFIAGLRDRDRAGFDRLVARVQRHYPRLVAISPRRTRGGWTHLEITEKWNAEKADFNARQVSDGLLRLIGIAAMHELPVRPSMLLLDEIENGLHPHLLGALMAMLRDLLKGKPDVQIVAATHSPIVLNYCDSPREVVLVTREHGAITLHRMDASMRVQKLLRHFDLGELWYNVGDQGLRDRQ